jgi:hypothetical protein
MEETFRAPRDDGTMTEITVPEWGPFSRAVVWVDSSYRRRISVQVLFPSGVRGKDIAVEINDFRTLVITMTLPKSLFDAGMFGNKKGTNKKKKNPLSVKDETLWLHSLGEHQRKTKKVQVQFQLPFEVSDHNIAESIDIHKGPSDDNGFVWRTMTVHLTPVQRGMVTLLESDPSDASSDGNY